MAGLPAYDYQQLAQALLANVATAGVAPGAGAANAGSTARYSGDHMDIERVESPMKKFISKNCVDIFCPTSGFLVIDSQWWVVVVVTARTVSATHPTGFAHYSHGRRSPK